MRLLDSFLNLFSKPAATRALQPYRSVSVGINDYAGASNDLRGCVNDVQGFASVLKGYDQRHFIDSQASKQNVLDAWRWAVQGIQPGQVSVVTISSHGSQVPDTSGDEPDALDEVICCPDFPASCISDDEIAEIFTPVPDGALVVMFADCCHSGTLQRAAWGENYKGRSIPVVAQFDRHVRRIGTRAASIGDPRNLVLLSACKPNEVSFDALIDERYAGAFSHTCQRILATGETLTYERFIAKVQRYIQYPQTPQLYCSPELRSLKMFTQARS